jgi:putative ABC transport system permease protein
MASDLSPVRLTAGMRVPLVLRQVSARRGSLVTGAVAIGLALAMMLLLDGLWTGLKQRATAYEDHTGAQVVVLPAGSRNLFADAGTLPERAVGAVASVPGVDRASGVRTLYSVLELHGGKAAVALVGAEPGGLGGPWRLRSGRAPGDGEVVVDAVFAEEHALGLGDRLPVLGGELTVVGHNEGPSMFMTPLVFTTGRTLSRLVDATPTTGAVLVATTEPDLVTARLRGRGFTVMTTGELRQESLRLTTRIYGGPLRLMVLVSFVTGILVIALVAYTAVEANRRDFGLLKAMGATPGRLRNLALGHTAMMTALGGLAGGALFVAGRALVAAWRPDYPVSMTGPALGRTAVAAAAMALIAAWLPARRVSRMDAASAFRGSP